MQGSFGGARGAIDLSMFSPLVSGNNESLNTGGNPIVAITIITGIIGSFRVGLIGAARYPKLTLFPWHRADSVAERIIKRLT